MTHGSSRDPFLYLSTPATLPLTVRLPSRGLLFLLATCRARPSLSHRAVSLSPVRERSERSPEAEVAPLDCPPGGETKGRQTTARWFSFLPRGKRKPLGLCKAKSGTRRLRSSLPPWKTPQEFLLRRRGPNLTLVADAQTGLPCQTRRLPQSDSLQQGTFRSLQPVGLASRFLQALGSRVRVQWGDCSRIVPPPPP